MRSGVTYQDVALAAEELQQAGERPTIERVRAHLGSTGSNTTISKYLQAWRDQATHIADSLEKKPTPNIVQAAVDSVWQQMRVQADAEIEAIQETARQSITAAQTAMEAAQSAQALANQQLSALETNYHALSAEHELLKLDLKAQQHQFALAQEKYQALEARFNDMQTCLTQQMQEMTTQHAAEISRLTQLNEKSCIESKQSIDTIKSQYESARHDMILQLDAAKTENDRLSANTKQLENQIQALQLLDTKNKALLMAAEQAEAKLSSHLQKQEEHLGSLKQSILMPEDILSKITNAMTVEKWFATIEHHTSQLFEKKLKQLDELIESLQSVVTEETIHA